MVFQPVGFTKLPRSHGALVSSYLTFSSLPALRRAVSLSVALSVTRPFPNALLPVRKHGALCCPDFPPQANDLGRWSDAQDVKERSTMTQDDDLRSTHPIAPHIRIVELDAIIILKDPANLLP